MQLDATRFGTLVQLAYGKGKQEATYRGGGAVELTRAEAEAIVTIAGLAVDVDQQEDDDEVTLFDELAAHVYELAHVTGPPVQAPVRAVDDDLAKQLTAIAAPLRGKPSARLAYMVGYLVAVVDLQLAVEESDFVDVLEKALGLDDETADELAEAASELLTGD